MSDPNENRPGKCGTLDRGPAAPSLIVLLLLAVYAAGLTHDLARPWTGMHDWNGAFFSQLARNCLRYPTEVHHGMPIVAVGEGVPPPEERSIYATHPPGLVWLVAGAFYVLGDAEWVARLVPVLASLGSLGLLVWLIQRESGWGFSLIAGLLYSAMPMAVYFGRMVDHEAVCLLFMLASMVFWRSTEGNAAPPSRRITLGVWGVTLWCAVWVDWSGVVFAGLFCLAAVVQWRRGLIGGRQVLAAWGVSLAACGTMLVHLVFAGLDGRWKDLVAIFLSRTTEPQGMQVARDLAATGGPTVYVVENLTWPIIALSIVGVVAMAGVAYRTLVAGRLEVGQNFNRWLQNGLVVLTLTGLVWLLVFWRQFERHNYWLFYLGPVIAVWAARGVWTLRACIGRLHRPLADVATFVIVSAALAAGFVGVNDYFQRTSYPLDEVRAWQEIHRRTDTGDRVLLYNDPVRIERRGAYLFRNIVPPQVAYYLDRAFAVEQDIGAVAGRAATCSVFVIPIDAALTQRPALAALGRRSSETQVWTKVLFRLQDAPPPVPADRTGDELP